MTWKHSSPRPMTSASAHDRVVELLGGQPRGRLLDIPAGQGALSKRLQDLGFDVRAADICPELFCVPGIKVDRVNLNERLLYENRTFDYVVCVAGIQRVIFPEIALCELHRILQKGGRLYLGFPNYINIRRRLQFLRTGILGAGLDIPEFYENTTELEGRFRAFLSYHRVKLGLEKAGFQIDDIVGDRLMRSLRRHWALVLYIRLSQKIGKKSKRKERTILPENNSSLILGSESLIFCCTALQS